MSSVAEDHGGGGVVVRRAFDADKWEVGIAGEGGDERGWRDEGCYAGEVGVKECGEGVGGSGEGGEVGGGEEERACK